MLSLIGLAGNKVLFLKLHFMEGYVAKMEQDFHRISLCMQYTEFEAL